MNKILVGLDGSQNSFKALEEAIKLAKLNGSEVHTISVEEIPRFSETLDEIEGEKEAEDSRFREYIEKANKIASSYDYTLETHILSGHEVKVIIEYIKKNKFDLLVIGFMGQSALYNWVMGSTSQNLVRLAPCNVLVVK